MSLVDRRHATHDVLNQPPPLEDYNLFDQDVVLRESVEREGGAWGRERLSDFGRTVGGRPLRLGVQADRNPPVLRDRKSTRLNSSHVEISYAVFCLKKKKKQ